MSFHDEHINFRLNKAIRNRIQKVLEKDFEKFDNEGHFIRCAIMKLLREVEE